MHIKKSVYEKALLDIFRARAMAAIYDENRQITSYVHSTSKGHEAIQLATAYHLKEIDWVAPYYRDESILLGIGMSPYELMLQLLGKKDDPFSGGRTYYAHPSLLAEDKPKIAHQSSATGMQAIPTTGIAHGLQYLKDNNLNEPGTNGSIVVCSIGDGSMTEGEVSEALQMAVLHQLPILYLVQDNDWGISASGDEMRAMNAYEFAAGFKGLRRAKIDGSSFTESYNEMNKAIRWVRKNQKPMLIHAKVPLLGHHTSGVRSEWYRDDLEEHQQDDPLKYLLAEALDKGIKQSVIDTLNAQAISEVKEAFDNAVAAENPDIHTAMDFVLATTDITDEVGERHPAGAETILMVDAALHAVDEILTDHPEALLYGQDVGHRLGGVFREAATLAGKHGKHRVFNTPIQEAYIIGSTAGMSAVGCKPIVEVQFADYIWPGVNQLVTELSKSNYLSGGKFPVQSVIRVPTGAYGGGGPYHSGTNESSILPIKGIKIVYPSNAADMKGLMKAAFYDPNPVVIFEHKGIYWSKVQGTEGAKTPEPSKDYRIPLGKARIHLSASQDAIENGESLTVITYGMGVWWASNAAKSFDGNVEIVDLRTLSPCDDEAIYSAVKRHGKVIVLTEETLNNSFAQAIAGRIQEHCFQSLDAPVKCIGSKDVPAIPLHVDLEKEILPNAEKVATAIQTLLDY
ncbi:MAG: thiamine pyrophosphate-dependent enzyme [Bacteroidia bacterium]|jgi:2-oxoisovalerate dehydrogenase E1 component|tara:strand:+ start:3311 stop:5362 length:2052 start_codon:yes stop_codon:yes gene_type:complete